jgi:hypothetical protein
MSRVLLVEDDGALAEGLEYALTLEAFEVLRMALAAAALLFIADIVWLTPWLEPGKYPVIVSLPAFFPGMISFALTCAALAPFFLFLYCRASLYRAQTRAFRENAPVWLTLAASLALTPAGIIRVVPPLPAFSLTAFLGCTALLAWDMSRLVPTG